MSNCSCWDGSLDMIAVELTLRCNARCIHCGSSAGRERTRELRLEEHLGVLQDLERLGCREICYLGGEPFLSEYWFDLGLAATEAGLGIVYITNGSRVDDALVDGLKRIAGLSRVAVSLDGALPEIHDFIRGREDSHREVLCALDLLTSAGLSTGIITTVMRPNLLELEGIRDLILGRGIAWQIQLCGNSGSRFRREDFLGEREFYQVGEFLHESRKRYSVEELPVAGAHDMGYFSDNLIDYGESPQVLWRGCRAGLDVLGLTSDGGVKGCLSLPDPYIEASIRERSLLDIWRDPDLFTRNRSFCTSHLQGFCATCQYAPECRGGCMEIALSTTGTPKENLHCFHRIESLHGVSLHGVRHMERGGS